MEVYPPTGVQLLDFPDYASMTPGLTSSVPVVSFAEGEMFAMEVNGVPLMNDFSLRFTGGLKVDTEGAHTLWLTSDDGSALLLNGQTVIDNGGAHFVEVKTTTINLPAGVHTFELIYFQRDLGAQLKLEWQTPNGAREVIPASAFVEVNPPMPGLRTELAFTGGVITSHVNFATAQTAAMSRTSTVNYGTLTSFTPLAVGVPYQDHFAVRMHGSLRVDVAGVYTFYLTSDDGSQLLVDGAQVVDNNFPHFAVEVDGTVTLSAGWHTIEVHYFQHNLGAVLKLEWSGPSILRGIVPAENLWDSPVLVVTPAPETAVPTAVPETMVPPPATPAPPALKMQMQVFKAQPGAEFMDFPDYDKLTPGLEVEVDDLTFVEADFTSLVLAGVPLQDDFAVRIEGSLKVDTAGLHTFYLTSDDGSLLFIDGHQYINNGGAHFPVEKAKAVMLSAGWHAVEVQYFQRDLGAELSLEWEQPNAARAFVPEASLGPVSLTSAALASQYASEGRVSGVRDWLLVPVHMAVLPDGRVFAFGTPFAPSNAQVGGDVTIWNPDTDAYTHYANMFQFNTFCSAVVYSTSDERLAVVGGNTLIQDADRAVSFFDYKTDTVVGSVPLVFPRWYGTLVVLHDGRIVVLGGCTGVPPAGFLMEDEDVSEIPELYDPATQEWVSLPAAGNHDAFGLNRRAWWYPRGYAAPRVTPAESTKVFGVSGNCMWILDIEGQGSVKVMDQRLHFFTGASGGSVMYTPGKILVLGGGQETNGDAGVPATHLTAIVEYDAASNNVTSRPATPMHHARNWVTAVVLPNGEVAALGGTRHEVSYETGVWVQEIEIWTPPADGTNGGGVWREAAKINKPRLYHSTAVLLPDGRVLLGGGAVPPFTNADFNPGSEYGAEIPDDDVPFRDTEIFTPWYLFNKDGSPVDRPVVTYNGPQPHHSALMKASLADASHTISKISIVTLPAVTHSHNTAQTFTTIPFVQEGATITFQLPDKTHLPPGAYYIFFINSKGVPSEALRIMGEVVVKLYA